MKFLAILLASALGAAHFVLEVPPSIGFNDAIEATAPCDGFDITSRKIVTDFPVAGSPIQILSTHPKAEWEVRAALLNNTSNFTYMVPRISQQGIGIFCLPSVPGIADWEGLEVIMQMIQHAVDGALYQCAALKFVSGPPASIPSSCKNATGIIASFISGSETATATATSIVAATTLVTAPTTATTSASAASSYKRFEDLCYVLAIGAAGLMI
ncbi:hypothetical protein NKR23_g10202 [Pleurostoma richardsiae]|uniref:Copper acquisition factor BIM1-like domain-containing protein n=1 Tax=Pleurostoma richardsiae TaxID=41990 RepID=A0AA38R4U5_9PEZI|nr:hypothetical protein NKR23_g10202 [Pleurostoma richardsiae]